MIKYICSYVELGGVIMNEREEIERKVLELKDKLKPEFLIKLNISQLNELDKLLKELEDLLK